MRDPDFAISQYFLILRVLSLLLLLKRVQLRDGVDHIVCHPLAKDIKQPVGTLHSPHFSGRARLVGNDNGWCIDVGKEAAEDGLAPNVAL